jgi:hypothetical protein
MENRMTETKPALSPLTLDDIRAAGPDRDNAEALDPAETWATACDKVRDGHDVEDVADLLMQMDDTDLNVLAEFWKAHTLATLDNPAMNGRDFHCPDLRLAMAIAQAETSEARVECWCCAPTLDPESLWQTVDDFDRMKAENAKLRQLLTQARDTINEWATSAVWDEDAGEVPPPEHDAFLAEIDEALGAEGAR